MPGESIAGGKSLPPHSWALLPMGERTVAL